MELIQTLKLLDELEPRNSKARPVKGFTLRALRLLFMVFAEEGENQTFYRNIEGWTRASASVNTNTLIDYGFIEPREDKRVKGNTSKRLYLTKGTREYLMETFNLS